MLSRFSSVLWVLCAASPGAAQAASFTHRASLSVLDVPVAETMGKASVSFGLEFFVERDRAGWGALPLPLSVVAGVGDRLDFGFSAQFGGLPGDVKIPGVPVLQWTLAAKYLVLPQAGWWPAFALEAQVDRPTANVRAALRAVASSPSLGPLRLTAFAGAELGFDPLSGGATAGLAVLARHASGLEGFAEGLYSSRGFLAGLGARWALTEYLGFTTSTTWIPQEATVRVSVGFAIFLARPPAPPPVPEQLAEGQPQPQAAGGPRKYLDDRPRLRLRIRPPRAGDDPAGRHYQYPAEDPGGPPDEGSLSPPGEPPPAVPLGNPSEPAPTPEIPSPAGEPP